MNGGQGGLMPPDGGHWPNEGPRAGGGTPYGQEPYGAPGAYGRQLYGQDGTEPQGGPYRDPYGTGIPSYGLGGEPPKKSRAGLLISVAVVAVIVVLGAVAAVIGASSGDGKSTDASPPSASPSAVAAAVHTIRVPRTFGGYRRLTGSVADRTAQRMRKSMDEYKNGKYAGLYATAKIAIYAKEGDSTQRLIFTGFSSSDNPAIAKELKSRSPSEEADSAFIGTGIGDTKDFPPGPLGGVLRCGTGSMKGTSEAVCAWADSSTVGVVLVPDSRNATTLAGTTLKLRNAAEH